MHALPSADAPSPFDAELLAEFVAETREQTATFETTLLALERQPDDRGGLDALLRSAHTVKGSAGIFELDRLEDYTHRIETLLELLKEGRVPASGQIGALLRANDHVRDLAAAMHRPPTPDEEREHAALLALIDGAAALAAAATQAGADAPVARATARTPAAPADDGAAAADTAVRYVRVPVARVDRLIELLAELTAASLSASALADEAGQAALTEAGTGLDRLIAQVHEQTMRLRMLPIAELGPRLRRLVRDTAQARNQAIALTLEGGDVLLDRGLMDRLAEPLAVLLGWRLAEGLESAAERHGAGKPALATLALQARQERGGVLLRIEDDGRSVDRQSLLQQAWCSGRWPEGEDRPDAEVLALVFEADAGRGPQRGALAAARAALLALRGDLRLSAGPSGGLRIDIRLPLALGVIDGFVLGVGVSRFVVPLDAVVEIVDGLTLPTRDAAARPGWMHWRGQPLAVVDLSALLGIGAAVAGRGAVVVLDTNGLRYGVWIDAPLGQQQTLVKPLGPLFKGLRWACGSSVLASGLLALILDVAALGALASTPQPPRPTAQPAQSA